jgi:hypothetical protein
MIEGNQLLSLINRLRGAFIGRDEGIFLPFNTYLAVPATGTSLIAVASVTRVLSFISWTQAVYVATTNDATNYWEILLSDATTGLCVFDTSAGAANTWYGFNPSPITQPVGTPVNGYVGIYATKHGAPGNLYWGAPAVRVM